MICAGQREIERRRLVLAHDLQPNLGAGRTAHFFHRLAEGEAFDRRAVDLRDDVTRQNSGLGGRRIVDRGHHLEEAVLHVDLHAEAAELAAGLRLHVAVALRIHVARMRIERAENAVDGRGEELPVVRLVDIVGPHHIQHLADAIRAAGRSRRRASVLAARPAACPDMMPSMNRAAPAAAPMTILGNLNMAFFLADDGQHARRAIHRFRRDPAIPAYQIRSCLCSNSCKICPGFTISCLRPRPEDAPNALAAGPSQPAWNQKSAITVAPGAGSLGVTTQAKGCGALP